MGDKITMRLLLKEDTTPEEAYEIARHWSPEQNPKDRIPFAKALDEAWAAIQERGAEYIYTNPDGSQPQAGGPPVRCYNWHTDDDVPGCIVGLILFRLGVSKEELILQNVSSVYSFSDLLTRRAQSFLALLQGNQDAGRTWGGSFIRALDNVESYLFDY